MTNGITRNADKNLLDVSQLSAGHEWSAEDIKDVKDTFGENGQKFLDTLSLHEGDKLSQEQVDKMKDLGNKEGNDGKISFFDAKDFVSGKIEGSPDDQRIPVEDLPDASEPRPQYPQVVR